MHRRPTLACSSLVFLCSASATGCNLWWHTLGGKVRPADKREYGHAEIDVVADSDLFRGLPSAAVWMSHGDEALELPPGFELTARSPHAVAGIQNTAKKWYAVQFPS